MTHGSKSKTPRTTWPMIAEACGVDRRTITEWRKRPDAPRNQDIEEWGNESIDDLVDDMLK